MRSRIHLREASDVPFADLEDSPELERLSYMARERSMRRVALKHVVALAADCVHGDVAQRLYEPQSARNFVTRKLGQLDVEKDQRRRATDGEQQSGLSIPNDACLVTVLQEAAREQLGSVIVVENQDRIAARRDGRTAVIGESS